VRFGVLDYSEKLDEMAELRKGWDGYDADAPEEDAIDMARFYLMTYVPGRKFLARLKPSVQGGVGATFRNPDFPNRRVYMEFFNEGDGAAMFISDGNISTVQFEDSYDSRKAFYVSVHKFLNGDSI
jgi:hypothetical protein